MLSLPFQPHLQGVIAAIVLDLTHFLNWALLFCSWNGLVAEKDMIRSMWPVKSCWFCHPLPWFSLSSLEIWPYLKPRTGCSCGDPSHQSGGVTFLPIHHTVQWVLINKVPDNMVVAFSSLARILGECLTIYSPPVVVGEGGAGEVETSLRTLISLFMTGSVHSGSERQDGCGWMFPDRLCGSLLPDTHTHKNWTESLMVYVTVNIHGCDWLVCIHESLSDWDIVIVKSTGKSGIFWGQPVSWRGSNQDYSKRSTNRVKHLKSILFHGI